MRIQLVSSSRGFAKVGSAAVSLAFAFSACSAASDGPPLSLSGAGSAAAGAPGASGVGASAGTSTPSLGGGGAGTVVQSAGASGGGAGGTLASGGASTGGGGTSSAGGSAGGAVAGGGAGAPTNAIETVQLTGAGQAVTSKALLDAGELYLLKAAGALAFGDTAIDAEYGGFSAGTDGQDALSGSDVGVDVGFKIERTPKGTSAGRKKWFGAYRADHTYYLIVTGSGAPLTASLLRPANAVGVASGLVSISLLRLSPTAPALAAALDTIPANVTKQTAHSVITTQTSVVYLLQASGSGKTGGNNLGLGDADWMDWAADGAGKVDIGDQDVDYGLGVDESDPKITPRLHWWGPWRKDHSYFMLFAGTGQNIAFSYYDVGDYGDNSTADKITVHVFPVP